MLCAIPATHHPPQLNRTVLITAANHGYLNHLLNFKCWADRLNLKFIVFAMDERIHSHLVAQFPQQGGGSSGTTSSSSSNPSSSSSSSKTSSSSNSASSSSTSNSAISSGNSGSGSSSTSAPATPSNLISVLWKPAGPRLSDNEEAARFRSKAFNAIVTRKKKATLSVMQQGYDLVFADTDVVIVQVSGWWVKERSEECVIVSGDSG